MTGFLKGNAPIWAMKMLKTFQIRVAASLLLAVPALAPSPTAAQPGPSPVDMGAGTRSTVDALAVPPRPASASLPYRQLVLSEAAKAGLPFAIIDAVMSVESGYDPGVVGGVGEIGLMQVRPQTAAMMGFKGLPGQLAEPATNIHFGATYLGRAWRLTKGDVCRTLMKYRAGTGEEMMSALSASYCARARAHLVAVGSPLAASITPADLVAAKTAVAQAGRAAVPGRGRARSGSAFWAAFEAKVHRINARIEARWKRVAAR